MTTTLVVGATGTVGTELVRLLSDRGHTVRSATRRSPAGPGQVTLDLATGNGLATAFQGVDRAFFLAPPGFTNQHELLAPLIDQAREHRLRKVVLMTAMGANADEAAPLRRAERHLEASGLDFHIIRPNWFMQNFHTFWLHGIVAFNKILLPVGPARGSFIDARDISAVAAELLSRDDVAGREFDLTGAQALNHDEVATILSRVTGRTITFEDVTPDAMRGMLLGAGLPADYTEFLLLILGFFKAGYAERTTDAVQVITGRAPRTFEAYAQEHKAMWAAA